MFSRPQATLLAVLALSSFVQATWVDQRIENIIARQDTADLTPTPGSPSSATPTSPSTGPSSTTIADPTTTTPAPSSSSTTPTPTPTPPPTTDSQTPTPSSTTASIEETTSSSRSTTRASTTSRASITPAVVNHTIVETVNGNPVTRVTESTLSASPTDASSGQSNNGNDGKETSDNGMSPKTKSTIIGVVVGIGGAILLAGLGVVAWRIWGRKKQNDEGDELMGYSRPDTGAPEKTSTSSPGSNPFQSTLESYHNPARVNASSNF